MIRIFILAIVITNLPGCYYLQAARGQFDVLRKREPVEELLARPDTPDTLKQRLQLVQEARWFAVQELLLPDNDSYSSYSEVTGDYVIWNVFAVPEFALQPRRWCYPIAGCVSYRGYFRQASAERTAAKLKARDYDVVVNGSSAYSTLGRFDDPILSTMLRWSDTVLIATLFHELGHQLLYVKNDTQFNESFASAVEEVGITRWLDARKQHEALELYQVRKLNRQQSMQFVSRFRKRLTELYESDLPVAAKRSKKAQLFAVLADELAAARADSGNSGGWILPPANNAQLVPLAEYDGLLPAFRALLAECEQELACFYAAAQRLTELPIDDRHRQLNSDLPPDDTD